MAGDSYRKIEMETGVSKSEIALIKQELCLDKENLMGGHLRKLTPQDERRIVSLIINRKAENGTDAAKHINSAIDNPISVQTVRNILKRAELKAYVKKKKPFLKNQHRKARLLFSLKYRHWTKEVWKKVLYSDETKINRFGSDGRKYMWKPVGSGLIDREVEGTVKFGGGSLIVWGCMGWEGLGIMAEVEGRMDAQQYVDILEEHLGESVDKLGMEMEDFIFQQDNNPKHPSKKAQKWFQDNGIQLLDLPAQSPDLNPIEHLWSILKKRLNAYDTPAKGMWELWERTVKEQDDMGKEECQKLIESMPRRLEAVIKAKGGHTKY